jgi:MFS family permease
MGWSRGALSSVAFVNWIALGLGSLLGGYLSDRFGARAICTSAAFVIGLGMVVSSQVTSLPQFYVSFGLLVGFGVGACYAPLTAGATRWFTANGGLAVATTSAGIGIGIMAAAPLARWLISAFDWRMAMLVLGDLVRLLAVPAGMLLRDAPTVESGATSGTAASGPTLRAVVTSWPFAVIALTHFACCAHSGPIFHMVTHAIDQGIDRMVAATVLSVSALASIAGRIGTGLLADRLGAKPTLLAGLILQAVTALLYLLVHEAWQFYTLALFFGVAYGGVMPLYALFVREGFGERVVGTAYGAVFFVSTFGMGLGSCAGGYVYDRLGAYAWLFTGSFAVGLAAVVLALAFRPIGPARLAAATR